MKKLLPVILLLGIVTLIFGTIEATAQQVLRQGANDPQVQLAIDAVDALNKGAKPSELNKGTVDIATSRAPFVIIYDKQGKAVGGNGWLDNKLAVAPEGILTNADGKEYHIVTWQPMSSVRIAAVTASAKDYYVLSGRSLKDVEAREDKIMRIVLIGWVVSLLTATVWSYLQFGKESKGPKRRG